MVARKMALPDYYVVTGPWYYVLNVAKLIYAACFIAFTIVLQNATVPMTVTAPGQPWGTYFSLVYKSLYWLVLFLSCWRIMMYVNVEFMILYRKTRACSVIWFVGLMIITLIDLLIVVGAGQMYGNCNLPGQTFNPCNAPDRCCVPEIYQVAQNGCANMIACQPQFPTLLSQLRPNADFMWFFYVSIGFLLADVLFVLFFAGLFYSVTPTSIVNDDPLRKDD